MKRHTKPTSKKSEAELQLLKDLERQSIEEIRKLRTHERVDVRVKLEIRPGNASQNLEPPVQATTNDVSASGCAAVSPIPLGVGDIFRLTFEKDKVNTPLVFARCVRCRLLREDAFEVAMSFFSTIEIGESKKPAKRGLLD